MRKEEDVVITDEGRDHGKTFHIREMSAIRGEKWAMRALMLVASNNADIGEIEGMGMQGIAALGIQGIMKVQFVEAEPLLDEMMQCITFKPDPDRPAVERPVREEDIEEVATLFYLRRRVVELHVGFSMGGAPSQSTSETRDPPSPSSNTRTSHAPSAPSSPAARRR
jgi:hypothetical protein